MATSEVALNDARTDPALHRRPNFHWRYLMPLRTWKALGLVLCLLSGCNANYVFDDADYRPLGDPQASRRGD